MDWIKRHGKIIYRFAGEGMLEGNERQYPVSFQVAQLSNGKIVCVCEGEADIWGWTGPVRLSGHLKGETVSASGSAVGGGTCQYDRRGAKGTQHLRLSELHILASRTAEAKQPEEMRFTLTNLEFYGVRWELDGYTITIQRLPDCQESIDSLKAAGGTEITASATVSVPGSLDRGKAISLIDDLCLLLTLARGCGVAWLCWGAISGGQVIEKFHRYPSVLPYTMYDLIPEEPPEDLRYFIERCLDPFRRKKEEWQLLKAIRFYTGAKAPADFVEARALKMGVLMDFLRGLYLEMNSKSFLVDETTFGQALGELKQRVGGILNEVLPDVPQENRRKMTEHVQGLKWYPFRAAVRELCAALHLVIAEDEVDRFVRQRNELTHRGHFVLAGTEVYAQAGERIFREMMTFVGRVILAILEYDGYYYDWTRPPGRVGNSEMRVKMALMGNGNAVTGGEQ
jgi:hypothetical protein